MSHIYGSIQKLASPELITEAAIYTGEDSLKVKSAITSLIASLLTSLLIVKDDNSAIEFALRKAGKQYPNILANLTEVFSGKADERTNYLGVRFLDALLGNKVEKLITLIATDSNISARNADKLIYIFSPIIASSLGDKLIMRKINLARLSIQIRTEESHFSSLVPYGFNQLFKSTSLLVTDNHIVENSSSPILEVDKNKIDFLKWGLIILGLVILGLVILVLLWIYYK